MRSDPLDPDGEMLGCSVGYTIGVSDISASRVLQSRNVPSVVSRTIKTQFSSGGVVRSAANLRVFFTSDKHDRRQVSLQVACVFTLRGTSKPGPPLAARNRNKEYTRSNT